MPAHGDQHKSYSEKSKSTNPYITESRDVDEYTALQIETLQSRLEKRLGPEYISWRAGPGGQRVHYLSADKCINLANEIFGFNGWSSSIQDVHTDFLDENPNTGKISLGLSVIIRVTLKNGMYHEDIGYGHMENCKGKAAAFEKAKKEGTTDALKRALRNFGNALGNCIYDKDYLSKVTKMKVIPAKWDVDELHRHPDYAPIKKEIPRGPPVPKVGDQEQCDLPMKIPDIPTKQPKEALPMDIENDFGSDAFDEADFGDHQFGHPDEVLLDDDPPPPFNNLKAPIPPVKPNFDNATSGRGTGALPDHLLTPSKPPQHNHISKPFTGQNSMALATHADRISKPIVDQSNQYKTPRLPQSIGVNAADLPPPLPCDQLNPDVKPNMDRKPNQSPSKLPSPSASQVHPNVEPGVWYSARAANITEEGKPVPTFDPKFESPSLRKTHSVTHGISAPVCRGTFQNVPPPTSSNLPHKPNLNNGLPASQSTTPLPPRTVAGNKRPAPGNFASPARPAMTTSYRPPTRRSTAAASNNATSNLPNGNTAASHTAAGIVQNINGKRPPLSEMTNMPPIPNQNEAAKKPRVGEISAGSCEDKVPQQRQGRGAA